MHAAADVAGGSTGSDTEDLNLAACAMMMMITTSLYLLLPSSVAQYALHS